MSPIFRLHQLFLSSIGVSSQSLKREFFDDILKSLHTFDLACSGDTHLCVGADFIDHFGKLFSDLACAAGATGAKKVLGDIPQVLFVGPWIFFLFEAEEVVLSPNLDVNCLLHYSIDHF